MTKNIINRIIYSIPMIIFPTYIILCLNYVYLFFLYFTLSTFILYEYIYNIYNHHKKKNMQLNEKYLSIYTFFLLFLLPFIFNTYYPLLYDINRIKLLKLITLNFFSDSMQFFSGKNIKNKYLNRKPFMNISPNKTYSGYIGGFISCYLLNYFFINLEFILFIYFFGVIGDLIASFFKRQLNIKDYSNFLGDHGGFLDRLDSLILNLPFFLVIIN